MRRHERGAPGSRPAKVLDAALARIVSIRIFIKPRTDRLISHEK